MLVYLDVLIPVFSILDSWKICQESCLIYHPYVTTSSAARNLRFYFESAGVFVLKRKKRSNDKYFIFFASQLFASKKEKK